MICLKKVQSQVTSLYIINGRHSRLGVFETELLARVVRTTDAGSKKI